MIEGDTSASDDRRRENGLILGLLCGCQIRKRRGNCPLQELVDLPEEEQIRRIEALSAQERNLILAHHHDCSSRHIGRQKR